VTLQRQESDLMDGGKKDSPLRYLGFVSGLGIMMIACIAVGLMAGVFLDGRFGTSPWLTTVFLLIGILSGAWSVFKMIISELRRDKVL